MSRLESAVSVQAGLRAWLRRHAYSLLSSLGALVRQPVASAMTVIVLAIALSLPAGLHSALSNLRAVSQDWQRLDSLSVFLLPEVGAERARELDREIGTWPGVAGHETVSPGDAMDAIGRQSGFTQAVAALEENPLPWVIEVAPDPDSSIPVETLADQLGRLDDVDTVLVDLQWLDRLESMLAVINTIVVLLAALFALAVIFVIGNTIRLDIHNRREEIEVMTLVGATDAFIRRPFLYAGLWYGLAGGMLAWLLVSAGIWVLDGPVDRLAASYASGYSLSAPGGATAGLLVAGAGLLGLAGAWVAVNRHLRRINPA